MNFEEIIGNLYVQLVDARLKNKELDNKTGLLEAELKQLGQMIADERTGKEQTNQ